MRTEKQLANLKKFDSNQSQEEAKKNGRKGGKKSGEVRRAKKTLREYGEILMALPISDEVFKAQLKNDGVATEDMTNGMALMVAMMQKALQGDTQAFNSFRDSSGQKPVDKSEATINASSINFKVVD